MMIEIIISKNNNDLFNYYGEEVFIIVSCFDILLDVFDRINNLNEQHGGAS